ncbi:MAG TPA: diacylglycerol kinase family protein, partial [Longimicrobiaceae bacterium]|nr:diacylglycerol kinase family protein [Longimicrobiaceae bacterium]
VAGQADTERTLRLLAGAFAVRGVAIDVVQTGGPGDAERFAREGATRGYRAVVAVGGDGTVAEVITGLAGTGVPLGIIPKGTGNQVACNLGIPRAAEGAVEVAVNGAVQAIDLGRLADGRYFAVAAGAGWDAEVLAIATRELKDRWGFGAYVYAGLRVGVSSVPALYRITADGRCLEVKAAMVLVANMGQIAGALPSLPVRVGPAVSFHDGKLDVCIFAPRTLAGAAAVFWRMARGRYEGTDRMLFLQAEEVLVEADPAVITEIDGEVIGQTPLSARAVPGGIHVLVPK